MSLRNELSNLANKQKDLDAGNLDRKAQLYWAENSSTFTSYLREIARAGRSFVQVKYIPNQEKNIDVFIPIEISLRLNSELAPLIGDLIKKDLGLNVTTNLYPKPYQYISW